MDLIAIAALTAAAVPLLAFAGLPEAARVPLGLPFLLFLPGYALIAAIFPRPGWPDAVERLALSAMVSLAVVALIGIALNYSPWGVRAESIIGFVGLFILLSSFLGLLYRRTVPATERPDLGPRSLAASASRNARLLAYPGAAALGLLAAVAVIVLAIPGAGQRGTSEPFTEFYLLGADGTAEGYPTALTVGDPARVKFGVVNREGVEAQYTVSLLINGAQTARFGPITLPSGERREHLITFSLNAPGAGQTVRLVLQKDGQTVPYRSLHLRVDALPAPGRPQPLAAEGAPAGVEAEPLDVAREPEPEQPAAGQPPPAQAEAAPRVHTVTPGENLTSIAGLYDITLKALLGVNELDDPDLIYPNQRINLPPVTSGQGS
jgi:uncharacterized membrane protein